MTIFIIIGFFAFVFILLLIFKKKSSGKGNKQKTDEKSKYFPMTNFINMKTMIKIFRSSH